MLTGSDVYVYNQYFRGKSAIIHPDSTEKLMNEDVFHVTGEMSGTIRDERGGLGEADYKLEGKIENNIFSVSIRGYSEMAEGFSFISGSMKGSLADSHGSGIWQVSHNRGSSSGEYMLKKMQPSK